MERWVLLFCMLFCEATTMQRFHDYSVAYCTKEQIEILS